MKSSGEKTSKLVISSNISGEMSSSGTNNGVSYTAEINKKLAELANLRA